MFYKRNHSLLNFLAIPVVELQADSFQKFLLAGDYIFILQFLNEIKDFKMS